MLSAGAYTGYYFAADSGGWWKRLRRSFLPILGAFLGTWPKAGTMRDGVVYRQPSWEDPIGESGSGLWPTVEAEEARRGLQIRREGKKGSQVNLTTAVHTRKFPTPSKSAAQQGQNDPDGRRGQTLVGAARGQKFATPRGYSFDKSHAPGLTGLDVQVRGLYQVKFPTPSTMDAAGFCGKPDVGRVGPNSGRTLTGKVLEMEGRGPHAKREMYPTPVDPSKGGGSSRSGDRGDETPSLQGMARKGLFTTPKASDSTRGDCPSERNRRSPTLAAQAQMIFEERLEAIREARQELEATEPYQGDWPMSEEEFKAAREQRVASLTSGTGLLNPLWVAWLMGTPYGWESLEPLDEVVWPDWSVDPGDGEHPEIPRVLDSPIPQRPARLRALGNGQVPLCECVAFETLVSDLRIEI